MSSHHDNTLDTLSERERRILQAGGCLRMPKEEKTEEVLHKEEDTLAALRALLDERKPEGYVPENHDDSDLMRFVVARECVLEKCYDMFNEHLKWHREVKPDEITEEDIYNELAANKSFQWKADKWGHPCIYFFPRFHDGSNRVLEEYKLYTIHILREAEKYLDTVNAQRRRDWEARVAARKKASGNGGKKNKKGKRKGKGKGQGNQGAADAKEDEDDDDDGDDIWADDEDPPDEVTQFTVVMDLTGYGWSNYDISGAKALLTTLNYHFPERIFRIMCLNTGWVFWAIWKIVSPLMPQRTREKMLFLSGPAQYKPVLDAHFVQGDLLREVGGEDDFKYDFQIYHKFIVTPDMVKDKQEQAHAAADHDDAKNGD